MRSEHGRIWHRKYAAQAHHFVLLYLSFRHQPTTISQLIFFWCSRLLQMISDQIQQILFLRRRGEIQSVVFAVGFQIMNGPLVQSAVCKYLLCEKWKEKRVQRRCLSTNANTIWYIKKEKVQNDTCQSISEARCFISSFFAATTLAPSGSTWTPIHFINRSENYVSACSTLLEILRPA